MNNFFLYATLQWAAVTIYILATICNVFGLVFEKERTEKAGYLLAYAGLLVHGVAIVFWWIISGHGPYVTRNEVLSSDAWIMLALFIGFARFYPVIRPASIFAFPAAFLLIALGLFFNPAIEKLPPTFKNIWLVFHISFYKIALATIVIALAFSVFYILKKRTQITWLLRLPSIETIDLYAYRFSGFGFVFWGIAMLMGSIWAYEAWGRFWAWDPVETWSLITWMILAFHLHLRRFFRWQGERSAYLYMLCFATSVAALFFLSHLETSIHVEYFK